MTYYQVTVIFEEELFEKDLARMRDFLDDDLRDSMDHMEFRNLRVDVTPLPQEREEYQAAIIPPAGVVHPWDEGKWIFPDDHPLHDFERHAYADAMSLPPPQTNEIKKGMLALMPPTDNDGDDV